MQNKSLGGCGGVGLDGSAGTQSRHGSRSGCRQHVSMMSWSRHACKDEGQELRAWSR